MKNIFMVLSWNLQNMLETPFPSFISKNRVKFRHLELFWRKFNFALYFPENRPFRSAMFENVIVTSYVGRFSKFWYQWKGETLPYTMVPHTHTLGMSVSSSWGGGNTPLWKMCYGKYHRKTRVKPCAIWEVWAY